MPALDDYRRVTKQLPVQTLEKLLEDSKQQLTVNAHVTARTR